jgi:hypothetical protein
VIQRNQEVFGRALRRLVRQSMFGTREFDEGGMRVDFDDAGRLAI